MGAVCVLIPNGQKYVRAGATGTGTGDDWTNAYPSVPNTLTRGSVYWIAAGKYGDLKIDDPDSGGATITLKKAIADDHGTDTGWQPSYGDGQAEFIDRWDIEANDIEIHGNGERPTAFPWNASYGFKVTDPDGGSTAAFLVHVDGRTIPGRGQRVALRHVEIDCSGNLSNNGNNGIRLFDDTRDTLLHNIQIRNCGADALQMEDANGVVAEWIYMHTPRKLSGAHSDGMQAFSSPDPESGTTVPNVFRWSWIEWSLEQQLFWSDLISGPWDIYGAIFISNPAAASSLTKNTGIKSGSGGVQAPLRACNNTFVDVNQAHTISAPSGLIRNSLYYNLTSGSVGGFGLLAHDYNWFHAALKTTHGEAHGQAGSDPFVNYGTKDLRLAAATQAGDLAGCPAGNAVDLFGNVRGADGVVDRGALEFTGAVLPIPGAPSDVRVIRP